MAQNFSRKKLQENIELIQWLKLHKTVGPTKKAKRFHMG